MSPSVPVACQNETETAAIERHQDDEETGSRQERSSRPPVSKRPCKRLFE
jgi:hypothetical protein